jgi:pilus assembly protein TadC
MKGAYFYRRLAILLPRSISNKFKQELIYVGSAVDGEVFAGFMMLFSVILGAALSALLYFLYLFPVFLSLPVFFILILGSALLWLNLAADSEGHFVETVLPDALQLIASNIKSGLTTERSLFVSAQKEFGLLSKELKKVGKNILSGQRLEDAIIQLPKRIKSKLLARTIWLITHGIGSGGRLADLLLELAQDLRDQKAVHDEIRANVSIYVLLIFFSAAFGAPLLLGVSTFIVEAMYKQTTMLDAGGLAEISETTTQAGVPMAQGATGGLPTAVIDPAFVIFFATILLIVNAIFVGLTMGVINSGREKNGAKFIPVLLIVSFIAFYATRYLLVSFFGPTLL